MRKLLLCTAFLWSNVCIAGSISVNIFVGAPPDRVSMRAWRSDIRRACIIWYRPAGIRVREVSSSGNAHIIFTGRTPLPGHGATRNYRVRFPHIPQDRSLPIWVYIDRNIKRRFNGDVRHTLTHEVGHTIGLPHRYNSIMEASRHRSYSLTRRDRADIRRLKRYAQIILGKHQAAKLSQN